MSVAAIKTRLDGYTNKNIRDICPNNFHDNGENHCAHFVCHVLGYSFGFTCNGMAGATGRSGVCIRVQELFPRCPAIGLWEDDRTDAARLIFVTARDNVSLSQRTMANVRKKHVGIYLGASVVNESTGRVWHYLNSQDKCVRWTVEEFDAYFKRVYSRDATLYYGSFLL